MKLKTGSDVSYATLSTWTQVKFIVKGQETL